jgi:DNA repair protein RadA
MSEHIALAEAANKMSDGDFLPTGSSALDQLLGGGFHTGTSCEVYGESNSGKTQLAMQAAMCAAHQGFRSLFIDTEGTFRPERIEEMALERGWDSWQVLRRISYLRAADSTQQVDAIRRLAKGRTQGGELTKENSEESSFPYRMVVIDTLTKNFTLDYPGRLGLPRRQGAIDLHLAEISRDAFLNRRAYVLANRVTFASERKVQHIGGLTLSQMINNSLSLVRKEGSYEQEVTAVLGGSMHERRATCHLGKLGLT